MKPRLLRRKSLWIFTTLACCGFLVMIPVFWLSAQPDDAVGDSLMVSSVMLAICWAMIRIGRARVEIHDGGLVLIDWWSREWIPWGAYRRVETDGGLTVVARGDKQHTLMSFGGSVVEEARARRGKGLIGGIAQEIRTASRAASPESLRETEVTVKRWEFIPADLLLAQVLVCLALTQSGIVPM
ncbi:hypothetical protein ACIQVO_22535 [Streptomyces sp. NPDC101062]|uniref:hypothetical protein n=1 Tax=unclassified Streptomyces TaxID=2593676 RepID=UPI002E75E53D|nr:hypothetical protein [Streptomyces sp. JV176]MEE1804386.1 hypothetical protein [Streptomyces sp. JV176]